MKASLLTKLDTLADRHEEVGVLLSDSEIISDQNRYRDLSREYSELETVVHCFARFRRVEEDLAEAQLLLRDSDADLREMASE
jgi:peptide chain release factor 1